MTTAILNFNFPNWLFYYDWCGGTCKIFLYNTILGYLCSRNIKCMTMAANGIAACLLNEGQTAYSSLAISSLLYDASNYNITTHSILGQSLHEVHFIVLDKACVGHCFLIEAIDRYLRDIRNIDSPYRGVVVLYSGDFCQILSVVVRGGRK